MTWGVVVNPKDGLAYVNDDNNGLWIIKIEPKPTTKVVPEYALCCSVFGGRNAGALIAARALAAALVLGSVPGVLPAQQSGPAGPTRDYLVLVASEAVDKVALIRFGASGARVEREKYVGWSSMEVAGPHGVAIAPDGASYFVSTAHGTPFGKLTKINAKTDVIEGSVMLGNFPATAQVTP
jgi:hypothetical protein